MIQQINLYQETDHSGSHWRSNRYALSMLASILVMLIMTATTWLSLTHQKNRRLELQQQLQTASQEVMALQAKLPTPQSNVALDQQLHQTQSIFQSLNHIIETLNDDSSDKALGFSRYFLALSGQSDNHVWLSNIAIDAANNRLTLEGSSYRPESIPALLQRLQQTEAFKGRHFAKLQISQNKDTPELVDFSISSAQADEDKDESATR